MMRVIVRGAACSAAPDGLAGAMETLQLPPGRQSSFGALLRHYRASAGLTQEELAGRAGLSVRNLRDLERGTPQRPQHATIDRLAVALAVPPAEQAAFVAAARGRHATRPAPASLRAGAAPPFVGRARELALFDRHLAGQGPPVLLLAGEPGIGKSRLLQAAAARALGHGLRVLAGGCLRRGGQLPYTPLLEALQQHLQVLRSVELRRALQGCAWLVRLLPELAAGPVEPLPAWTLPPEQERRLMVEAVKRVLTNVAGPGGILLVLDDLQWAGADALDLLATLAHAAPTPPVRLIGAYRSTEVQPGDLLSRTVGDLAQAGLAIQHQVGPLAPEEAAWLLAQLMPEEAWPAAQEQVLRRAGGVPFFLVSWAQTPREERAEGEAGGGARERVPWTVAQGVEQRLAALSWEAQEVVGAAAVAGRVVPRALLAQVTGRSEQALLEGLEAACRARLLEEEGTYSYRFVHDVIREVVEARLGTARRTLLHRRVAEALSAGEAPVEDVAYHYARTDEHAAAALWLERAGDRAAARYAHDAAQANYREGIDHLDRLGRTRDVARICEKLGIVLATTCRYEQALQTLERAAALHRAAGDLEAEGQVTATIGKVHSDAGTWEAGIARVRPLVASLEAHGPTRALAALYIALVPLFAPTGRYREYLATAERASSIARSLGDRWLLADGESWRGLALAELDRPVEARPVLAATIPLAEAAQHLRSLCRASVFLGETYLADGAIAQARAAREQALDAAERLGDPQLVGWAACRLADVHVLAGAWTQAHALYERAIPLLHGLGGSARESSTALVGLGALVLHQGRREEASRYLEEGAALAARTRHLRSLRAAQQALAERDLLDGRPRAALARLQAVRMELDLENSVLTKPMPALARVQLALGQVAEAEALVGAGVARARERCNLLDLAEWLLLRGMVEICRGRGEDARRALDEALTLARGMPYPYAEGRLLHACGQLHAAGGAAARERLEAALAIFRRLGARKDIERVEEQLGMAPLRGFSLEPE